MEKVIAYSNAKSVAWHGWVTVILLSAMLLVSLVGAISLAFSDVDRIGQTWALFAFAAGAWYWLAYLRFAKRPVLVYDSSTIHKLVGFRASLPSSMSLSNVRAALRTSPMTLQLRLAEPVPYPNRFVLERVFSPLTRTDELTCRLNEDDLERFLGLLRQQGIPVSVNENETESAVAQFFVLIVVLAVFAAALFSLLRK